MTSGRKNGNGAFPRIAALVALVATLMGATWTAKGYVDDTARAHNARHRSEYGKLVDKLGEVNERLARIETQLGLKHRSDKPH